jgi:hypothetical protein
MLKSNNPSRILTPEAAANSKPVGNKINTPSPRCRSYFLRSSRQHTRSLPFHVS